MSSPSPPEAVVEEKSKDSLSDDNEKVDSEVKSENEKLRQNEHEKEGQTDVAEGSGSRKRKHENEEDAEKPKLVKSTVGDETSVGLLLLINNLSRFFIGHWQEFAFFNLSKCYRRVECRQIYRLEAVEMLLSPRTMLPITPRLLHIITMP